MSRPSDVSGGAAVVGGPRLAVACVAVRRTPFSDQEGQTPRYQVCLVQEGRGGVYAFPTSIIRLDQDPEKAALDHLRHQTGLIGTTAHHLSVRGKPHGHEHTITIVYLIPVGHEGPLAPRSSVSAEFHSLGSVLENADRQYQMAYEHREMVYAVDQWLKERHAIPFVNTDLLFLCSGEGEGIGGLVKAIIDNPIYNAHIKPPEDELVISLNNPIFQMSSSHDLETAVTSNT